MGEPEGGFVICRPAPAKYKIGDTVGLSLLSDLHIGSADVDYALIDRELAAAKESGDRVLINGDVFDLILPGDHKRFRADCLHPRIRGRADVINAAIEWATEILAPVADQIDMIGCGNHESAVEKHHSIDPILMLLDRIKPHVKSATHTIHYGGFTGFVDYRWQRGTGGDRAGGSRRLVLYYHHGSGGGAPVTRGMIDFHRKQWVWADVVWMGHKHNRWSARAGRLSCPLSGDRPDVRDVPEIMTGSYFSTYHGQSQASIRANGRRTSYAADGGLAPQGKGGARVLLEMLRDGYEMKVVQ